MLKELINRARGQVWLRVTCPYPERVLNLCSARKLAFWDLEWEGAETFTCRMSRGDHRVLSRAAEKLDCTIEIVRREGAPYTLAKLRHRQTLAVGIAACGAAVLIGSFFVWDIQIAGNETVPREVILRSLENNGVHRGCFGFALNGEDIRNHVLLEVGDLSWLTVNVKGCVAHVQVVERQRPPEIAEKDGVWNIVAARDGLVTRVQALDGKALVSAGSTVTAGELLVTGVYESREGSTYMTHSLGTVEARTWYDLSVSVPLTIAEKSGECREKAAISVDIGKKRIKLWGRGSISGPNCDKITYYHPLTLPGGLRLPITLVRETVTVYAPQQVRRSREQAQKEGETLLVRQLRRQLRDTGRITETKFSAKTEGENLIVLMQAECLEQIGLPVQVQAEENN